MTTLVAWVGVDQRGPASLYLASDSRLTWPSAHHWDAGRKLFAARLQPHILGYCGDVLFPTQVLGQLVEMIDAGLIVEPGMPPVCATGSIADVLTASLATYPVLAESFSILHGYRLGEGMTAQFFLHKVDFHGKCVAKVGEVPMPRASELLVAIGSGSKSFLDALSPWSRSEVAGTSRAVFSALADSIERGMDSKTGGPPQLTGLYRKGGGRTFGVMWKGRRYFYGTEVKKELGSMASVKWHNELFEVCDPSARVRAVDAQPQPRPRGLQKPTTGGSGEK